MKRVGLLAVAAVMVVWILSVEEDSTHVPVAPGINEQAVETARLTNAPATSLERIQTQEIEPQPVRADETVPAELELPRLAVDPEKLEAVFVSGSRVNLRDGPGTQHAILDTLAQGTELELLDGTSSWMRVRHPVSGRVGFMSARYLSRARPAPVQAAPASVQPPRTQPQPSAAQISAAQQEIIRQSIARYSGNCPCPYNRDAAGRRCGKRSAWSRPGGASPICYPSDISDRQLQAYLNR